MRSDDIGMFWEDIPQKRGRETMARVMPPIPETGWLPPRDFPNLSSAACIALDVETYDPDLKTLGPGWARRGTVPYAEQELHSSGALVGVSVAADNYAWYFPIRHTVHSELNMPVEHVLNWLRDTLGNPHQPKVGANLIYDIGWLRDEGVPVAGQLLDVQFAEALLTETGKLELDTLAEKYLGTGKETSLLYKWCADYYGGNPTPDQRKNIYRAPPELVGPYAEADARLPLQVFQHQWHQLEEQGLLDVYDMECKLVPLLLDMRFQGVAVDLERAQQVDELLTEKLEEYQHDLKHATGHDINVNAADSIAPAFDALGIPYPRTPKTGRPSFTKPFLASVNHPVAQMITDVRRCMKLRDTFIRGYILECNVNSRIHAQFHQLRGEEFGTRSGRLSSSNPNLQNIPIRDDEKDKSKQLAPMVRSVFVPDPGHAAWRTYDYSQIEYRYLVHFAVGPGSDAARQRYANEPDTDYHEMVRQEINNLIGVLLDRKPVKNINFGLVYGMGIPLLAASLNLSIAKARELFEQYHQGVPYVAETLKQAAKEAEELGYVTTILGRRSRFELWEPHAYDDKRPALPYDKALHRYGRCKRAGLHKALNRRLQGSAADHMKKAMVLCYEQGLFDDLLPALTVHDELDFSDPGGRDKQFQEIVQVMETCIQLAVPTSVTGEIGDSWGYTEKIRSEDA